MKDIKLTMITAILFLLAGVVNSVNAQNPVSFGVKGGVNIANLSGDNSEMDSRNAITVGAVIDISFPVLPLGIETGLYYSQKGASAEDGGVTETIRLDYLEVPVMAKISFGPPGPVSPHIVAGPYVGFVVNSEFHAEGNGGSFTVDLDDDTESLDFGAIGGLGVDFNLGLIKLNIQARYSLGFVDTFDGSDSKNRVLSIVAGITF